MIVPDLNLLLYAYDSGSPHHRQSAAWWAACLSGTEPIGLADVVVFGFMRIATHIRVFQNPLTVSEAASYIRAWRAQPPVCSLEPGRNHVEKVLATLESLGTASNLVTDAQLAVLTIDNDAVLHTADADFQRFPGLRWFNPVSGLSSGKHRAGRS